MHRFMRALRKRPRIHVPTFKAAVALLLLALPLLAACAPQAGNPADEAAPPTAAAPAQDRAPVPPMSQPLPPQRGLRTGASAGKVDRSCGSSADCAVKDVGNCCGYYPACVNKDSQTFPEQVKAQCEQEGRMSVCGFRQISGCQCVEERCEPAPGGAEAVQ